MNQTHSSTDRSSLIPGAHRLIRAIDGKEGPFAGTLITYAEGVAVCVSADQLADWPGWAFSDAEHVCGVVDVRRRTDGNDALLPWCTTRAETFLGRRQVADAPLTAGELGTLVASVVRGVRELEGQQVEAAGDWWLTSEGRPVFVHGEGGAARARSADLIERGAQHTSDRATSRLLDEIVAALRTPRHRVEDERRWEDELFAIAAPRALRLDVFAPERVDELSAQRTITTPQARQTRAMRRQESARPRLNRWGAHGAAIRGWWSELVARVPRRGTAAVSAQQVPSQQTGHSDRRRLKSPRRRALLLAGSLGATVLIIGLMWPGGSAGEDAEARTLPKEKSSAETQETAKERPEPDSEPGQEHTEHTEHTEGPQDDAVPEDDVASKDDAVPEDSVLAALPEVLRAVQDCIARAETDCPAAATEGAAIPSEGVVRLGMSASTASLVEDYGDVAVVKLTPVDAEQREQMLVMERQDERWLLRDVYDVAKQPA